MKISKLSSSTEVIDNIDNYLRARSKNIFKSQIHQLASPFQFVIYLIPLLQNGMLVKRTFIMAPYNIVGIKMLQKWQTGQSSKKSLGRMPYTPQWDICELKEEMRCIIWDPIRASHLFLFSSEALKRGVFGIRELFSRKPSALYIKTTICTIWSPRSY